MSSFKVFVERTEFIEYILNEFNGVPSVQAQPTTVAPAATVQPAQKIKPWSAKKPEIMQMWQNLRTDTPIIMTPIADKQPGETEHSTYGEDGIRITGSWHFISATLCV